MTARKALLIVLVGAVAVLVSASYLPGSIHAAIVLSAKATVSSMAVGLIGAGVLRALRGRPLTTQMTVVSLATVCAVAAGAIADRNSRYLGDNALAALAVMLSSSGTVGTLTCLYLGQRVAEGSAELTAAARRIGRGEAVHVPEPPTEELADLARELEQASQRLEVSDAQRTALESARRELIAWISHDLRTPLGRIRALVEALEDEIISEPVEVADYHRRVRLEVDRLARLVDDLFEFSRITAGATNLDLQPTRLGDLVSDLVAGFSPIAHARDMTINAELHGTSPIVPASVEHIERALSNLIDNAIRYSNPGSTIKIETGQQRDRAYLSVSDGCGGMSAEELRQIIEDDFPRSRSPRANSGTGLGLAITRGLIEAHSGTIDSENTEHGCRILITLPLQPIAEVQDATTR